MRWLKDDGGLMKCPRRLTRQGRRSRKGQLTGLNARINSLERRVDQGLAALRSETHAGLRAVNDRIDALKDRVEQTNRRLDDTNKRLDEALDIRERLAALEARMVARG